MSKAKGLFLSDGDKIYNNDATNVTNTVLSSLPFEVYMAMSEEKKMQKLKSENAKLKRECAALRKQIRIYESDRDSILDLGDHLLELTACLEDSLSQNTVDVSPGKVFNRSKERKLPLPRNFKEII